MKGNKLKTVISFDALRRFKVLILLAPLLLVLSACMPFRAARVSSAPAENAAELESTMQATLNIDRQAPRSVVPTFTSTPAIVTPIPITMVAATEPISASIPVAPTATMLPPTSTPVPTPTPVYTGSVVEIVYLDTYSIDTINGMVARFYPAGNQVWARYAIDRYQIRFQTLNERGELVPIRADLFIPKVDSPVAFPIFAYGAGTTGIGNGCAPLDEATLQRNWGGYRTHMLSYAAQGYISILPHWQGYDDMSRTHPYFISELEGYILLDATRAVYNFFRQLPSPGIYAYPLDAIFFGGYSQGAHGAFAADKMASWYAPELPIKGIIGHASAPNVEALLLERPSLGPYIVYAYRDYYGADIIDPEAVFLPHWLATFAQDASTKCVDEAYGYYSSNPQQMYRPEFLAMLTNHTLGEAFPAFKQVLDTNFAGTWANPHTPALMLHGATDPIVTPKTAEAFITHLCRLGKSVTYNLYPGVNHFVTRQVSFVDTLTWMHTILNGELPRTDCAAFAGR